MLEGRSSSKLNMMWNPILGESSCTPSAESSKPHVFVKNLSRDHAISWDTPLGYGEQPG